EYRAHHRVLCAFIWRSGANPRQRVSPCGEAATACGSRWRLGGIGSCQFLCCISSVPPEPGCQPHVDRCHRYGDLLAAGDFRHVSWADAVRRERMARLINQATIMSRALTLGTFVSVGDSVGVIVGLPGHTDTPADHYVVWYGERATGEGLPLVRTVPMEYCRPIDQFEMYH